MRAFACQHCGQLLFFENSRCLRCGNPQGFVPTRLELVVVDCGEADCLIRCANAELARCNWLVEGDASGGLCISCRLTKTRPADTDAAGLRQFVVAEGAKRRLIFQLFDLGLPIEADLSFDLLSSQGQPITTGHADGLITLDLAESDDLHREQRRIELGEPYRTPLGHFRHEIGHYYWPIIVERPGQLDAYRELFGDERSDYQQAIDRHYQNGPPENWQQRFVTAYATMHPWEDWAETFAHYLHIRDTLETAAAFGIVVAGPRVAADESLVAVPGSEALGGGFGAVIANWLPLTYALNALNRSMGADDVYPFTLAEAVIRKLTFVHDRVTAARAT